MIKKASISAPPYERYDQIFPFIIFSDIEQNLLVLRFHMPSSRLAPRAILEIDAWLEPKNLICWVRTEDQYFVVINLSAYEH